MLNYKNKFFTHSPKTSLGDAGWQPQMAWMGTDESTGMSRSMAALQMAVGNFEAPCSVARLAIISISNLRFAESSFMSIQMQN